MAGIAFGRFDDSFSASSLKAYLAEFISTLIFVFAGVGSAIAYSKLSSFSYLFFKLIKETSAVPNKLMCLSNKRKIEVRRYHYFSFGS